MAKITEADVNAAAAEAKNQRRDARGNTRVAKSILEDMTKSASVESRFDVFLSHSFTDYDRILGIHRLLEREGLNVYVDWIYDPHLDRTKVNRATANLLRDRMRSSESLVVAYSESSSASQWVTWEMAWFDGAKGRVAVMPIQPSGLAAANAGYVKHEFYQLYPVIESALPDGETERRLWTRARDDHYHGFGSWVRTGTFVRGRTWPAGA